MPVTNRVKEKPACSASHVGRNSDLFYVLKIVPDFPPHWTTIKAIVHCVTTYKPVDWLSCNKRKCLVDNKIKRINYIFYKGDEK
jgi:argonaute-like protein implicated in RNA metabolism and viral defense